MVIEWIWVESIWLVCIDSSDDFQNYKCKSYCIQYTALISDKRKQKELKSLV